MRFPKTLIATLAIALMFGMTTAANAAILVELNSPPTGGVEPGDLEGDSGQEKAFFFKESDGTLGSDLDVDIVDPGTYNDTNSPPSTAPTVTSGTSLTSYFVHFDKIGSERDENDSSASVVQTGFLTLFADQPILGLITSGDASTDGGARDFLSDTDSLLGAGSTTYPTNNNFRGLEFASDVLTLSSDSKRLDFNINVNGGGVDQFRVLLPEGATLVPEPATLALLGLGGAVMMTGRKRRA